MIKNKKKKTSVYGFFRQQLHHSQAFQEIYNDVDLTPDNWVQLSSLCSSQHVQLCDVCLLMSQTSDFTKVEISCAPLSFFMDQEHF